MAEAYQGNLQTDFSPNRTYRRVNPFGAGDQSSAVDHYNSDDADAREAQRLTNEMDEARQGRNAGVSFAENQAKLDMYRGRIGMKNSLAERIAGAKGMLRNAEDDVNLAANEALDSGVKSTRQNFNRRGLLYSGLREGGEQAVRGAVAGQLAKGVAGARRDAANSLAAAKNAYASVDLANQQEAMRNANQAFDTANANNIARIQAMQQLGRGVGYAGGMIAGYAANRKPAGNYYLGEGGMAGGPGDSITNTPRSSFDVDPNTTGSWNSTAYA